MVIGSVRRLFRLGWPEGTGKSPKRPAGSSLLAVVEAQEGSDGAVFAGGAGSGTTAASPGDPELSES